MKQSNWTDSQSHDASTASSEGPFSQEKRAAEGLIDDVKTAASDAGSQAKSMATEKAEALQGAAASHLHSFADAVRTAGDELAEKDPGPISDLVRQAAAGLEQFSGALDRNSSAEMIDRVREFGRQNQIGFLAGSMLAGFALARFAGSGAPQSNGGSADRDKSHERGAGAHAARKPSSHDRNADRQERSAGESSETTHGEHRTHESDGPVGVTDPDAPGADRSGPSIERNWRTDV